MNGCLRIRGKARQHKVSPRSFAFFVFESCGTEVEGVKKTKLNVFSGSSHEAVELTTWPSFHKKNQT